jgi:hypothetical protein
LTWDKAHPLAHFLPNSTWAEGRNCLFRLVSTRVKPPLYVIFVDGDASISFSSISFFVDTILNKRPVHAVPLTDSAAWSTKLNVIFKKTSLAYHKDEILMALDYRIFSNCLGSMQFVTFLDDLSWYYPCIISQKFISKFFWRSSITVPVECVNKSHGEYPKQLDYRFMQNMLRFSGLQVLLPLSTCSSDKCLFFKIFLYVDFVISLALFALSPFLYIPSHQYSKCNIKQSAGSYRRLLAVLASK